jgi:hypothetical protein
LYVQAPTTSPTDVTAPALDDDSETDVSVTAAVDTNALLHELHQVL